MAAMDDLFGMQNVEEKEKKLLERFRPGRKYPSFIEDFFRDKSEFRNYIHCYFRECSYSETEKLKGSVDKIVTVSSVEKVINPYLYASYSLRKKEYTCIFPGDTKEVELFHDTPSGNADSIVRENLSWRLIRRSKFGKGVSFSPKSEYARRFGGNDGVFVVKVLMNKNCMPNESPAPPVYYGINRKVHYDTTVSRTDVHVKYRDDEFYPSYWIRYSCTHRYRY